MQLSRSPSLLRYLRWLLHGRLVPLDTAFSDFSRLCTSLFDQAMVIDSKLPAVAEGVLLDGQPSEIARLAWAEHRCHVAAELHGASITAQHKREKQQKRTSRQKALDSKRQESEFKDSVSKIGLPLWEVHEIVKQPAAPAGACERVVWETFRWVRDLYAALHSGQESYRKWLHRMTQGVGADLPEVNTLYESDFHWIGRHRRMPGAPCSSRVQSLHAGSWKDEAADDAGASEGVHKNLGLGPWLRRVLVSYIDATNPDKETDRFAALLVKVPFESSQSLSAPTGEGLASQPLKRRTAEGTLQNVTIQGKEVHFVPMALTVPRLHLLERVAMCFTGVRKGVLLSGVHGAGKSSMLQAIVGILAVGGECDIMFAPQAKALKELELPVVLGTALFGSGQLARQLWSGKMSDGAPFEAAWDKVAAGTNIPGQVMVSAMGHAGLNRNGVGKCAVVLLDEVNELLGALRTHKASGAGQQQHHGQSASAAQFWQDWLPWRTYGDRGCFRILSASPHGQREAVKESSEDRVEFELRPAPADHLAGIMRHAPGFLCGKVGVSLPRMTVPDCFAVCDGLGGNARYISGFIRDMAGKISNEAPAIMRSQLEAVRSLMVSRFDKYLVENGSPLMLGGQALCSLLELAVLDSSMVVREQSDRPDIQLLAGQPALLALLHLAKAATLGGEKIGSGKFIRTVCKHNFEEAIVLATCLGALSRNMRQLFSLRSQAELQASQGRLPEAGHGVLIWPSSQSAAASTAHVAADVCHRTFQLSDVATASTKQPVSTVSGSFVCAVRKLLPLSSSELSGTTQARRVFQTVTNFPGVDVICVEFVGTRVEVTFIEATTSTLSVHAGSRKAVLANIHGGDHDGQIRGINVSPVLRDIFALCGVGATRVTRSQAKDTVHFHFMKNRALDNTSNQSNAPRRSKRNVQAIAVGTHVCSETDQMRCAPQFNEDLTTGTSTANCLLATMGVPLVVKRRLALPAAHSFGSGASDVESSSGGLDARSISMESDSNATVGRESSFSSASPVEGSSQHVTMDLQVEKSDELCKQLHKAGTWEVVGVSEWSFRMVYASDTSAWVNVSDKYSDLKADFAYGVFKEDLLFLGIE